MRKDRLRGKFIVLEGIDGSGKATQLKLLAERLKSLGLQVAIFDFPQYEKTFFGQLVGRYLAGEFGDAGSISPYLSSLPFAGDRWQAADSVGFWIATGRVVLANRYIASNLAHQAAKLPAEEWEKFIRWDEELEFGVYQIPYPDLTIFLYVPPKIAQGLTEQKEDRPWLKGEKQDTHERDLEHLERASEVYQKLAEERVDWRMVDCTDGQGNLRTPEQIHNDIWEVIDFYASF